MERGEGSREGVGGEREAWGVMDMGNDGGGRGREEWGAMEGGGGGLMEGGNSGVMEGGTGGGGLSLAMCACLLSVGCHVHGQSSFIGVTGH